MNLRLYLHFKLLHYCNLGATQTVNPVRNWTSLSTQEFPSVKTEMLCILCIFENEIVFIFSHFCYCEQGFLQICGSFEIEHVGWHVLLPLCYSQLRFLSARHTDKPRNSATSARNPASSCHLQDSYIIHFTNYAHLQHHLWLLSKRSLSVVLIHVTDCPGEYFANQ